MNELKKKIAIIAAIAMLSASASFVAFAADDTNAPADAAVTDSADKADTDAEPAEGDAEAADAEDEKTDEDAEKEDADAEKEDADAEKEDADADKTDADAEKVDAEAEKADPEADKLTEEQMKEIISKVELEEGVNVIYNGALIKFDVKPQIVEDRTLVPLRAIFEALGAEITWDEETYTVTAVKGDVTIVVKIGEKVLTKNGTAVELDVPAQIVDDRTLVPLRAISESFGNLVDFDDATKTVIIRDVAAEKEDADADKTDADADKTDADADKTDADADKTDADADKADADADKTDADAKSADDEK